MNEICRKMWNSGTNMKKWSEKHGFSHRTVQAVIANKRGKWGVGESKRIVDALKCDGFFVEGSEQ